MASSVSPLTGSSASSSAAAPPSNSTNDLSTPSESVFLNLLVAQIQNQDPLNPTDSTQFVSQLAQFSELEQVIGIRSDIETQMTSSTNAPATPATGSSAAGAQQAATQNSNQNQTNGTTQA